MACLLKNKINSLMIKAFAFIKKSEEPTGVSPATIYREFNKVGKPFSKLPYFIHN
jgi:hypothetical protein